MATLNVQDYGAAGDGSTNDTGAIQSAIDDASAGDTVYFPEGTYGVEGAQTILNVDGSRHPDNLTLEGEGEDSVIRYNGGNGGSNFFILHLEGGMSGFECRNLVLDGNSSAVSGDPNATLIVRVQHDTAGQSYLFEDVLARDSYGTAFSIRGRGVTLRHVTSEDHGKHGASYRTDQPTPDEELVVEHCHFRGNSSIHPGHYGIDTATGSFIVQDTVIEENDAGCKTSTGAPIDGTYRRVRIQNNSGHSYQSTNGDSGSLVFEDCVIGPGNTSMFRLSYIDYDLRGDVIVTDNGDGAGRGAVWVGDNASIDAETLWVNNNDNSGLDCLSRQSGNVIEQYNYANNAGGPLGSTRNLTIQSDSQGEETDLGVVPTADEVGAWANGNGSDPNPPPEPEPDSGATLATAGGIVQTSGGVIMTGEYTTPGNPSGEVVDDFEGYDAGTALEETDPWTAAGAYSAAYQVTNNYPAAGEQSIGIAGTSSYHAIQSTADSGLERYPGADCTIRIAVYLEAGSHDVAFGVPADEDNYHDNCYRLRGGPLLSRNPSLKRTVDGEMETLVSLDNQFPTDTWLEHVIQFEATGSEVVLTYNGYAWDADSGEWVQFEADTEAVDETNAFPEEVGVGLGTYAIGNNVTLFDEFRVGDTDDTGAPSWRPVTEQL